MVDESCIPWRSYRCLDFLFGFLVLLKYFLVMDNLFLADGDNILHRIVVLAARDGVGCPNAPGINGFHQTNKIVLKLFLVKIPVDRVRKYGTSFADKVCKVHTLGE